MLDRPKFITLVVRRLGPIGLLLIMGLSGLAQNPLPLDNPLSIEYLEEHLSPTLPRLVLNQALQDDLIEKIETDPVTRNLYAAIKLNAEAVFEKTLINLDIPLEERSQDNQLDISRDMLHRLNVLATVYRVEQDQRMLDRINQEVIAACRFPTWNPRHFLDVGEMSLAIALALDWTAGDLPLSTVEMAMDALVEKGIKPSWPEGGGHAHWAYGSNNWNQVCNAGMVAASLVIAERESELAAKTIHRALDGLVNALKQYGPDGVYPEGATYWNYGTSFTVVTAAMLESAFGTDLGISNYPGLKESAVFRVLSNAPSGRIYNFSDCSEYRGRNGDLTLAWFAKQTGNSSFFEEALFLKPPEEMGKLSRLAGVSLVWVAQFEEGENESIPTAWSGNGPNPVAFFTGGEDDVNQYYFGGKGGRGALSHGNMDAGSFVFELDGVRWSIDLPKNRNYGAIERTGFKLWPRCQECDRWKLLSKSNFGHSTISVNESLHQVDGQATITDFKDGSRPEVTIDLSRAFQSVLESATRRFIKDGPRSLIIEDLLVPSEETDLITWQMMTQADVEITTDGALLRQDGKELRIRIMSHPNLKLSIVSLDPPPHSLDSKRDGLKRLEIRIPAWTIEDDKTKIVVRLSGD